MAAAASAAATLHGGGGGGGGGAPANPRSILRMVQRTEEQYELSLGGDSLSALASLPSARLAYCGTAEGAVLAVVCGRGERDKEQLAKGGPVRPHSAAVTCVVTSADSAMPSRARPTAPSSCVSAPGRRRRAANLAPAAAMAPSPSPAAAAAAVAAAEDMTHTEVQCVTRETLERTAQELALALGAVAAAELDRHGGGADGGARAVDPLEASEGARRRAGGRGQAPAQGDGDAQRGGGGQHKKFGEAAGTAAERARQRRGQLEAALRKEIRNHDQLSGELASVRDKAAEELAALSVAVEASREERSASTSRRSR